MNDEFLIITQHVIDMCHPKHHVGVSLPDAFTKIHQAIAVEVVGTLRRIGDWIKHLSVLLTGVKESYLVH